MKFLVLAFCVCAASAASFQPFNRAQAFASVSAPKPLRNVQFENAPVPVVPIVPVVPVAPVPVAVARVKPVNTDEEAVILKSESDVGPESFSFNFETSNGIASNSEGVVKYDNEKVPTLSVRGQYAYTGPDGKPVVVTYVADENGYQPSSDVLPQAPEIPEAILRSLEYIRAHPAKDEVIVKKF